MVTYPPALDLLFLDVPSKFESVALHNGVMYDRLGLTQVMAINDDADAVAEGLVEVEDQHLLRDIFPQRWMPVEIPLVVDTVPFVLATAALEPKVLLFGRHLYQEEVDNGRAVAVVDEGLAIALFRQGNPVDLTFELLGQEFKVVGVVRHTRSVGDRAEYGLIVPLKAFKDQPAWEMLAAHFIPKGGSNARLALAGALSRWQPDGQVIDLVKEKYRTLLPLRFLICAFALWILRIGFSKTAQVSSGLITDSRERLKSDYALRLMPRFLLAGLTIALLFAAGVGLLFYVLSEFIAQVYIFPEWVPTILVEPRDIGATFWNNRAAVAGLVSLRTRELLILQALRSILTALAIAAGAMLITPLHYLKLKAKELR